jgi:hypothetical protein
MSHEASKAATPRHAAAMRKRSIIIASEVFAA